MIPTKETLLSHDIPERPWQTVGIDLLIYDSKDYLITTDYTLNIWKVYRIQITNSQIVITNAVEHVTTSPYHCRSRWSRQ